MHCKSYITCCKRCQSAYCTQMKLLVCCRKAGGYWKAADAGKHPCIVWSVLHRFACSHTDGRHLEKLASRNNVPSSEKMLKIGGLLQAQLERMWFCPGVCTLLLPLVFRGMVSHSPEKATQSSVTWSQMLYNREEPPWQKAVSQEGDSSFHLETPHCI